MPGHKKIVEYQRALFECLDEFFRSATGQAAPDFATIETFSDTIRANAARLASRGDAPYRSANEQLRALYASKGLEAFREAKALGGLKLVQGGGAGFLRSQLNAVSGSLLYADTILIPDPVLPWIESERKEEAFNLVRFLQSAHSLLHLKPLVDAELPYPAILVFPSWEKALEERDPHTKNRIEQLATDVIAKFIDPGISTIAEAFEYARASPEKLLAGMDENQLVVAPGGAINDPIKTALSEYDKSVETWRSPEYQQFFAQLSPAQKALMLFIERIGPQFHLLENSTELVAHPLLSLEQQAHYFKLVSLSNSSRLEKVGLLNPKTNALIDGLGADRLKWLSNLPIDAIVEIRKNNENAEFRTLLERAVSRLHESAIQDIDRVAAEISSEIDRGLGDYNRKLTELDEKYRQKYLRTAGAAAAVTTAALVPTLAPFIGAMLPFGLAAKVGWDAWDKYVEKRRMSKSLMGFIALSSKHS